MRRTSLESEYEWYVTQSQNPENPPAAQELWRQLAEELRPRIAPQDDAQEELW